MTTKICKFPSPSYSSLPLAQKSWPRSQWKLSHGLTIWRATHKFISTRPRRSRALIKYFKSMRKKPNCIQTAAANNQFVTEALCRRFDGMDGRLYAQIPSERKKKKNPSTLDLDDDAATSRRVPKSQSRHWCEFRWESGSGSGSGIRIGIEIGMGKE